MELVIVLLMIGVLLWIWGVSLQTLMLCVMILIALLLGLMVLFFVGTVLSLLTFRVRKGTFLRFEQHRRYEQAVYRVGEDEYTNLFPAEGVLRQQIYHTRPRRLLIRKGKLRNTAFDMHSVLILCLGLVGSVTALVLFLSVLRLFM